MTPSQSHEKLHKWTSRSNLTPRGFMGLTRIWYAWVFLPSSWRYDLDSRSCNASGHGHQLCEILSRSNLTVGVIDWIQISGMCSLWHWPLHFLYSNGPHPESSLHIYTFVVSRAFMAGGASQARDADSSRAPGLPVVCRGPWMSTVVLYCWCHSDSASVLLYFTFLSHLFPLPCGAGSTVPREGFDSSVIMPSSWCVVAVTLPI